VQPSQPSHETALKSLAIDLITDGADLTGGRKEVILTVRRVMLSARRSGFDKARLFGILMDTRSHRKLPIQIATGPRGRHYSVESTRRLLDALWEDVGKVVEQRPPWQPADVLEAIEFVREAALAESTLDPKDRVVVLAVLDLAHLFGTTRPAVPSRRLAAMTGMTLPTANRRLRILASRGEWLRLAKKGDRHARKASLYAIAPDLLKVWGASPPTSQTEVQVDLPTSHTVVPTPLPTSHSTDARPDSQRHNGETREEALGRAVALLMSTHPDELRRIISTVESQSSHHPT